MRLPAMSICLFVRLLKNACMDLDDIACQQVSGHRRTGRLLSAIRIIVRMPESDCFLRFRIALHDIAESNPVQNFITSGKSHPQLLRMVIGRSSQQRRVVLRRRNTVVGGKCALPSALLVGF